MKSVSLVFHQASSKTGDKIFINRRKKAFGQRIFFNENEILIYLDSQGFEGVIPKEFNMAGQANIPGAATYVVGIMGAAMANTIFARNYECFISGPKWLD